MERRKNQRSGMKVTKWKELEGEEFVGVKNILLGRRWKGQEGGFEAWSCIGYSKARFTICHFHQVTSPTVRIPRTLVVMMLSCESTTGTVFFVLTIDTDEGINLRVKKKKVRMERKKRKRRWGWREKNEEEKVRMERKKEEEKKWMTS